MPPPYRSQIFDHGGLVAAMFDALGRGEVMDRATRHQPATRMVPTGAAVIAMVLNGLGFVNQPRDVVPRLFQDTPLARLLAPWLSEAPQRKDEARGHALETLSADDVTARYRLMAATAAERRGRASRVAHLESTSCHVEGHDHSGAEPAAPVVPRRRGESRAQRPARNHVRLALIIEHHAGSPVLRNPRRGNRREVQACGIAACPPPMAASRHAGCASTPRHPHAQQTGHKPWRKPGDPEVLTGKTLCRTTLACEAEAPPALATLAPRLRAPCLHQATLRPLPRDAKRGRPGPGAFPAQGIAIIAGALASSMAAPQPLGAPASCCMLATHERDTTPCPPQEL